jgi:hypothetical protein
VVRTEDVFSGLRMDSNSFTGVCTGICRKVRDVITMKDVHTLQKEFNSEFSKVVVKLSAEPKPSKDVQQPDRVVGDVRRKLVSSFNEITQQQRDGLSRELERLLMGWPVHTDKGCLTELKVGVPKKERPISSVQVEGQ